MNVSVSLPARRINLTEIKFKKLHPDAHLPRYAHGPDEDAGMDLYAVEDTFIFPNDPTTINIGLAVEIPAGIEGQVRSKSGLSLSGVTVANQPGTLDPGFRGEIGVILNWVPTKAQRDSWEKDKEQYWNPPMLSIKAGQKIAQLVLAPYLRSKPVWSNELAESERGEGGFGSTGI